MIETLASPLGKIEYREIVVKPSLTQETEENTRDALPGSFAK